MKDSIAIIGIVIVLTLIGLTIYFYISENVYSHYLLGVTLISIAGLIFLTKSTELEKGLDFTFSSFEMPEWRTELDSGRKIRWGGSKSKKRK